MTENSTSDQAAGLRRRAEEKAKGHEAEIRESLSPEEARRVLHELRVHQIELEMQNEELPRAQAELEASRTRYFDLYDLAPVGYFTLSEQGLILEANLTAADLLGVAVGALVKKPLTRFMVHKDQDIYYQHRKPLFETGVPQVCELRLVQKDGNQFWARLEAIAARDADGAPVCRAVLSDITEHKRAEDRETLARKVLELLNRPSEAVDTIGDILRLVKTSMDFEAVGIRLQDGDDYPYYVANGFPEDFLRAERYLCERNEAGQIVRDATGNPVLECMCGNILRGRTDPTFPFFTENGSFWTNNTTQLLASTTEADRQARTRNRCNAEGYESVALIPLRSGSEIIGLVQLNDHRPNRFTLDLIHFFEGLSASIGIALERKRAEEALRESSEYLENLFNHTNAPIIVWDRQFRITRLIENCKSNAMARLSRKRSQSAFRPCKALHYLCRSQ